MDTTLVTITVLSMGMAAALSVIVWRMLRDERRRSEARVAALSAAAAGLPPRGAIAPKADLLLRDAPATPATPGPTLGPMFVQHAEPTPWWRRAAVMAGIALLGTSVLLFVLSASRGGSARAAAAPPSAAVPAAETPAAGLELLSLRDARTVGALTITGMVRNPRDASLRSRVAVTAYAFDDKGAFLASGRTLIDVTSLAPGDESPFVVSIPVTETVARYRIGFRSEDGRVISHVDKRQTGPMAANW